MGANLLNEVCSICLGKNNLKYMISADIDHAYTVVVEGILVFHK